jgi:two-component system LytT family response regulator
MRETATARRDGPRATVVRGAMFLSVIRRVLIADDEPLARERVASMVSAVAPSAQVREASEGDATIELIRDWKPHVVFLDVQMPGRNGFDVVTAVGAEMMPPTVFVTAHDEHAIHAFDVAAVDYLLKPFDERRFLAAWKRVDAQHSAQALAAQWKRLSELLASADRDRDEGSHDMAARPGFVDRVVVTRNQRTVVVKLAGVEWIESSGNYTVLHVGRVQHTLRETLSHLEARLDPHQFMRIHRRTIVAIDAMKELQPWFGGDQVMILKSGHQLRVSRTFRAHVARRLAGTG